MFSTTECIALEKNETVVPDEKIAATSLSALSAQKTPNVKVNVVSTAKKATGSILFDSNVCCFERHILFLTSLYTS